MRASMGTGPRAKYILPSLLVAVMLLGTAMVTLHQAQLRLASEAPEAGRPTDQAQGNGTAQALSDPGQLPRGEAGASPRDSESIQGSEDRRDDQATLAAPFHPAYASLVLSRVRPPGVPSPMPSLAAAEHAWLAACQTPLGALVMAPGDSRIVPYFANYAAMTLLRWDVPLVERYMRWYLDRLNSPDRFGLDGTIYDYVLQGGREVSQRDYDSADSYAATFLTLVARYVFATGNGQFVLDNLSDLRRVANVCLALQDPVDDLVWAKPDHRYKFLMDNCEVQLGLESWAELLRTIGLWHEAGPYAAAAKRIRAAIEDELWDERAGAYAWAKTPSGPRGQRRRWYPDAVGQLYPGLFGVIDPAGQRNQDLLTQLDTAYPRWPTLGSGDTFPWALVAYANARGGRVEQAQRFVDEVSARFITAGRPWPWYNMEAAFFADTVLELAAPGSSAPVRR